MDIAEPACRLRPSPAARRIRVEGMSSHTGRPQIPPDMKAFNDKVIAEFRANHGKLSGPLAASHLLLLTTTGAKSRAQRTIVLGYRRHGDDYIAIASDNGNDVA